VARSRRAPRDCRRRLAEDWRAERRANQRYEACRARGVMRDGRRFGGPSKPYSPPEAPEGKLNTNRRIDRFNEGAGRPFARNGA
jgi:hypothetical protein